MKVKVLDRTDNNWIITTYDYDEIGRLKSKTLHNGIETTNYSYNIRNWLTGIHGSKFEMDLFYEDVSSFGNLDEKSLYNGSISAIRWRNKGLNSTVHNYAFKYDGINRLTNADYGLNVSADASSLYDVSGIVYDKNGNIQSLARKEGGLNTDNLSYGYVGNKLKYVNDSANDGAGFKESSNSTGYEYFYDANGNLTKDLNKGITEVAYNCLNLPEKVVKGGKTVRYIYTATGEKLQNILEGKTITYNGAFVYEDGALQYILNEEGRYNVNGANAGYEYNLKDHLGSVRMVINSAGEVKQTSNYYPFGGVFDQFSSTDNKYQFGGKELQEETDWLDFGARMYQPELGRWLCFDPMAEKAYNRTPYRYCFNNPMNVTDPTGLYEWDYDMGTNYIQYVGDDGGTTTQYVNNFMGSSYLNTAVMGTLSFYWTFGKMPTKLGLGKGWATKGTYARCNYDDLVGQDYLNYKCGDNYDPLYYKEGVGHVLFQHSYTRGWYMSYEGEKWNNSGIKTVGAFNIHNAKGDIVYSTSAVSGDHGNKDYTFPAGSFIVDMLEYREKDQFMRHGFGFAAIISGKHWDSRSGTYRDLLRIHPARGKATRGCIGLTSGSYNDILIAYLTMYLNFYEYGHTTVKVSY